MGAWDPLLEHVKLFCGKYGIEIPDLEAPYIAGGGRFRKPKDRVSTGNYF